MPNTTHNKAAFIKDLLVWFAQSHRPLPWKDTQDAYIIWLSEIILQQTRVEQGLPYFERFRANYPTVKHLADAPEDEVMRMWEGLGYYSRARNLHATAKLIAYELNGEFPDTFENIRALKGVGDYTAAAIASFAYDLPHAVVDGNVYRVLSRYFGIATPIDTTAGKKQFRALADELLHSKDPATYNQAIMDFGATHCKPKQALCKTCLMQKNCAAFAKKKVYDLPVKSKKLKKITRYFHYLVINEGQDVWLKKRGPGDIWQNLYDFGLIEAPATLTTDELQKTEGWSALFKNTNVDIKSISRPFLQTLTHRKIVAVFIEMNIQKSFQPPDASYIKASRNQLDQYAFPRILNDYLNDNTLELFS